MSATAARGSFLHVQPPSIGIEIAADRVTVVSVDRPASGPVVTSHATEALPPGAVLPGLNGANILDPNAAGDTLRLALERAGVRGHRAALVIPDAVARVSILPFETVPTRTEELEQLIRWQARKSVPFPIDTAQVSWVAGTRREGGQDFIVTVARRDLIEEYEALCTRVGLHAGLVDLATFNVINAVLVDQSNSRSVDQSNSRTVEQSNSRTVEQSGDWLVVNLTAIDATLAIMRGTELIFFRNRTLAGQETLEDLVHQTAMYHEDRLGSGRFARVVVVGMATATSQGAAGVRQSIEARIGVPLETVDPRGAASLRDRITAGPALLEALAAPLGVLVRDREEVA